MEGAILTQLEGWPWMLVDIYGKGMNSIEGWLEMNFKMKDHKMQHIQT